MLNKFKISYSMLCVFSTTTLELENIILSNIIILCVFIAFLGIQGRGVGVGGGGGDWIYNESLYNTT